MKENRKRLIHLIYSKVTVLFIAAVTIFVFSSVVHAETLPVKDVVYYESYGDIYVLLENGALLFGDSIDTPNPEIVSTNVSKVIPKYKDLIILHNNGTIDVLKYFEYKNNSMTVDNRVDISIDVDAVDIVDSKSDFLYVDEQKALYKYDIYNNKSILLFESVKKCKQYANSYGAYVLTDEDDLFYINYRNTNSIESQLVLSGVNEFFVYEDECYALKKSGNKYYQYYISINAVGKLSIPERQSESTLTQFITWHEYDLGASENKYNIGLAIPSIASDIQFYVNNKNFYFTNTGALYKACGQTKYEKYFENVKLFYIFGGSNFEKVYLIVTQDGQLFASTGKVERTFGTDTLDAPYITSFCEKWTKVVINNKEVELKTKIQFVNNRSMYPFRECLENMGAIVMWDSVSRSAIGEYNGITVEFPIDKNYYYINGEIRYMDTTTYATNGRTYIPIRFAAEALGFTVEWEGTATENIISIFE